ncbi:PucR family transcriptional regulator ligand-binding domain-containing protein [Gordonia sp. CPCC 205515]|uniref:helix-turn-helix domain-containing protein n=1 Tax=Gordonia sp. CPCC 205515 TaxID=3140791 RepID=UPI003AF3F319
MAHTSTSIPTLREVIDRFLAPADPRVLTAHDRLTTTVNWVHSSEIFEIGPLLAGGELLLTTGLGLAGLDAGTRRHYVRDLAERGVAGVAMEIGRTFDAVPDEMVREGSARRLPIIELRRVVPFIEVCRDANTAIVSEEIGELRAQRDLDDALHVALGSTGGVAGMLAHLSEAVDAPVVLVGSGGALLAAHGVDDDRAAWTVVDHATADVPVIVRGRHVGRVVAGSGGTRAPAKTAALLRMGAGPLGAVLTRSENRGSASGARLVEDLVGGRPLRRADLISRFAAAGVPVSNATTLVAVAAASPDTRMATAAMDRVAAALGAGVVHAVVDASVFAVMTVGPGTAGAATDPAARVAAGFASAGEVTVVVGDAYPVADTGPGTATAAALADALGAAGDHLTIALDLVRDPMTGGRVFTGRQLRAESAVRALPEPERAGLARLITPLVTHDLTQSTQLVHTLEVHLRHGCSATRSAQVLHLGRQSLYQRLDRIRALLGFDPSTPETYTSILLAISAFRASDAVGGV